MKKIIISLSVVVLVGIAIAGATYALFSDTETSAGNVFTAGTIDLKVDHLKQTYNDLDCETCSLTLYSSDGQTMVTDSSPNATVQAGFPFPAVLTWVHPNWASHETAKWVWAESTTSVNDATNEVEYTFEREFYWNGVAGDIVFDLSLASDNGYAIYVNDVLIVDNLDSEFNYNAVVQALSGYEDEFKNALDLGENTLKIVVRNHKPVGWTGTPTTNPAGLLYFLSIERLDCDQDLGFQQACRLWIEKDLEEGDTFFNFGDIKPGDWGTNLISLHVDSNDAWACLLVDKSGTEDEQISEDLNVVVWQEDGTTNGTHEVGEEILYEGPLADSKIPVADATHGSTITGSETAYVGLAWCFGAQTADTNTAEITCSGAGVDNEAQGDTLSAVLTAYAEQWRNNSEFSCSDVVLGEETEPGVE